MTRKNYLPLIGGLAVVINGLILLSVFTKLTPTRHYDLHLLPLANAVLNGLTFLSLLIARSAIKRKETRQHRRFVFLAFFFTTLFLISYLTYHFTTPSTEYRGTSVLRYIYYVILSTHIILAIFIVPLAIYTGALALTGAVKSHRKIAGWTMPIWLYVSFTGVIVYLMISPYYQN